MEGNYLPVEEALAAVLDWARALLLDLLACYREVHCLLAALVAGLAILWIVNPAAKNPDFGHQVALLSIHLRRYHLQRLRLQHLNTLW
jgi:hypothetical protein